MRLSYGDQAAERADRDKNPTPPLRIGLLADQAHRTSGVGVYTRQLLRALARITTPHEFVLIAPSDVPLPTEDWVSAFPLVRLPQRPLLYPAWHAAAPLPVELWAGTLDLLHVMSGTVTVPSRAKKLVTVYDLGSMRRPADFPLRRRWVKHTMLRRLRRERGNVLTISQLTTDDVEQLAGFARRDIHHVHLGVDTEIFKPAPPSERQALRNRMSLPEQFILFVGAISPRKNIPVLLQAFEQLVPRHPDLHLVLAGSSEGWDMTRPQDVIRDPQVLSKIRQLGFVETSDLPLLYASSQVFVYPSLYEGFGLPILEAMACETPVVCADATALPEVAGDGAVLVDASRAGEVASAVGRLLLDEVWRREMIARGRTRAKHFEWDTTARRTLALYEQLSSRVAAPRQRSLRHQ